MTKVGRYPAGARAAAAHTGSLAGEDLDFDRVARQAGIIRARNEEHMLDVLSALVCNPAADGAGLAMITQSGGAGVLMADRAEEIGLAVPTLGDDARARLAQVLPDFGATGNPIDVTGQFLADPKILAESVRIALDDPDVHVCVIWLQLMHRYADTLVDLFRDIKRTRRKAVRRVLDRSAREGTARVDGEWHLRDRGHRARRRCCRRSGRLGQCLAAVRSADAGAMRRRRRR